MIEFWILGTPVAKARPRMTRSGHVYTPQKTLDFERLVAECVRNCKPIEGAVHVDIVAWFEPAKSWSKKKREAALWTPHTQRPDIDNLVKAILDGLNGCAFADDAQVAKITCVKKWGDSARTEVTISEL